MIHSNPPKLLQFFLQYYQHPLMMLIILHKLQIHRQAWLKLNLWIQSLLFPLCQAQVSRQWYLFHRFQQLLQLFREFRFPG
ncbi:MAG: hypothetical protein EBR82_36365 [Caulobacteraceae bacterium]|nr:hypothetical protein [Caulobacteraceae bacterium]